MSTLTPDLAGIGAGSGGRGGGLQPFTCLLAESLMHGGRYAEALEQLGRLSVRTVQVRYRLMAFSGARYGSVAKIAVGETKGSMGAKDLRNPGTQT